MIDLHCYQRFHENKIVDSNAQLTCIYSVMFTMKHEKNLRTCENKVNIYLAARNLNLNVGTVLSVKRSPI